MDQNIARTLKLVAAIIIGVAVITMIAANVFLNSSLITDLINRKPEKLLIRWDRAWMLWPGIVHLQGIEIRVQSRRLQWWFRLDKVSTSINLSRLPARHLQTKWINGQGLIFRLRPRLLHPDVQRLRDMPDIPGLSNPPDPVPERLYPSHTLRRPWLLDLGRFDVRQVRQVWIDRYRLVGKGRISGSMRLKVRGPLRVQDARIIFDSEMYSGQAKIARRLKLNINASVAQYVPRVALGIRALRQISGRFRITARSVDLAALERTFQRTDWFRLGGQGRLDANISIMRGHLLPGSRVMITAPALSAGFMDYQARGDGSVRLTVNKTRKTPVARLAVKLDRFSLRRLPRARPHVSGRGFKITAVSDDLDLGHAPYKKLDIALDIPESRITDLKAYNHYIPAHAGFAIESGKGRVRTHLRASGRRLITHGFIELKIDDLVSRFNQTTIKGDLSLHTRLTKGNIKTRRFHFTGTRLNVDSVRVIGRRTQTKDNWWGEVAIDYGKVVLTKPLEVEASLNMKLRDSEPALAIFVEKKAIPKWVGRILTIHNIHARARLLARKDRVEIVDINMAGDRLQILAQLKLAGRRHSGIFYAKYRAFGIGVEMHQGKRSWRLIKPRSWYDNRKREFRKSLMK